MKPSTRVKALAKQLVDPMLLAHVSAPAQQQLAELRAKLLEAVKLTPSDRVRQVAGALNELWERGQVTTHAHEGFAELRSQLLEAADELEASTPK